MKVHVLEREQRLAHSLAEVFELFARADNLDRIFEFCRQAVSRVLG